MGAKYGETRLVSPTAEVVCLGLAAVLGGVALVPGVRWATTQSRFRCDLGHLRDTVDYAYAVSFFEHDVRRIRSGGFDGWRACHHHCSWCCPSPRQRVGHTPVRHH
jgi:hypothetical protein